MVDVLWNILKETSFITIIWVLFVVWFGRNLLMSYFYPDKYYTGLEKIDHSIFTSEFKSELVKLSKIEAIKLLRRKTDCGLAKAKDCVESLQKEAGKIND